MFTIPTPTRNKVVDRIYILPYYTPRNILHGTKKKKNRSCNHIM